MAPAPPLPGCAKVRRKTRSGAKVLGAVVGRLTTRRDLPEKRACHALPVPLSDPPDPGGGRTAPRERLWSWSDGICRRAGWASITTSRSLSPSHRLAGKLLATANGSRF